jgi:predicted flap endonuclease-1-like 5' DNA nuclease
MTCGQTCPLSGLLILFPIAGLLNAEIELPAELPGWMWLLFFGIAVVAIFWWWWVTRPGEMHDVHELESQLEHAGHGAHFHATHTTEAIEASLPPTGEAVPTPEEIERAHPDIPMPSEEFGDVSPDDLTRIEGIGPKIAALLRENGILSFDELGRADDEWLNQLLEDNKLQLHDPTTWPEQAALAAAGKWDELKAFQAELKGGSLGPSVDKSELP